MNDKQLYRKCVLYGRQATKARRKFLGLLPEVHKREIASQHNFHYKKSNSKTWLEKRGFGSVFEFAAKLAGISREQVNRILRLERRFENLPTLHNALVEGKISANKLIRIATIATPANVEDITRKAELLSSRALEIYVREHKNVHVHHSKSPELPTVHLDPEVANELVQLQEKGIDINKMLKQFLRERRERLDQTKRDLSEKQRQMRLEKEIIGLPTKRYVPAAIKRVLSEEFGTKCSIPDCHKPAETLHHENGFAKDPCHNPVYLKPLCRRHHELMHVDDVNVHTYSRPLSY